MPLVRYAVTTVHDVNAAEDIVQQAFIELWNKRQSSESIHSVKAWLYKVVYYAALDYRKHEIVRSNYRDRAGRMVHIDLPRDEASEKEMKERIEKAIQKLPPECGKIFRMSREQQLKYLQKKAAKLGFQLVPT